MKKTIVLIIALCSFYFGFAQNTAYYNRMQHVFGNIDKTKVTTGYLKEFGIRFNEVETYNGITDSTNWVDKTQWQSLYSSLYTMRVGTAASGMVAPGSVFSSLNAQQAATNNILIALQLYEYQQYKSNAYTNGDVTVTNDQIFDVSGRNPYETKIAFAAMPLKQHLKGNSFSFRFTTATIYANTSITSAQIDFGDGNGFRSFTSGKNVNVTYATGGEKEMIVKFVLNKNRTLYTHSKIYVDYTPPVAQARFDNSATQNVTVTGASWQGATATGNITVELASGHSQLTKPLIVVEGFDPDNSFDYFNFINNENTGGINIVINENQNLTLNQAIEDQGYDLVFVNFANSTDYIQRNAYMVEAVINWVNTHKTGNEKNVVLGMSMGGLVAKYALRHMELNNQIHQVKLYVSHDAPHQGANVPLAYQAMVRHLVGEGISLPVFFSLFDVNIVDFTDLAPELEDGLALLQTPAAQQMLIYQLQGTGTGVGVNTTPLQNSFISEYSSMGYPQQDGIRNIAIANGSECGSNIGFSNYAPLVTVNEKIDLPIFLSNIALAVLNGLSVNPVRIATSLFSTDTDIKAQFDLNALPSKQAQQIYKGKIVVKKTILWFINIEEPLMDEKTVHSTTSMLALDNPSGGIYNLELFVDLPDEMEDYVLQRRFSFIPTFSSLDIGGGTQAINPVDLLRAFTPISPPNAPKNTPFDNFFTNPAVSENHIQFTLNNGNWLLTELSGNEAFYSCAAECTSSMGLILSGPSQICSTGTYSLSGLKPGIPVTWSVYPGGAASNIVPNANNTVSVTPSGNYPYASIRATIMTNCGEKTIGYPVYFGSQRPRALDMYGQEIFHIEGCTNYHSTITFNTPDDATSWDWHKVSGNFNLLGQWNSGTIIGFQPTFGIIEVRSMDECGWSAPTMITVNITNCTGGGGVLQYTAYPNPVSENLIITQNSGIDQQNLNVASLMSGSSQSTATLHDFNGNPVATISPAEGTINVSGFTPGQYILVIQDGDNTESHHIIIE